MRNKLLLSLVALAPMAMMAETLTPDAALQRAFSSQGARRAVAASEAPQLLYTQKQADNLTPAAYVFSRGAQAQGFMVVAADDVAAPVLGYSDDNDFNPNDIPANMQAMLETYAAEIAWANANGVATYNAAAPSTRADRAAIAPMIKTTWNQMSPYNLLCPTVNGSRCPTGCVATAMAQIMNYHQWPQGPGTGSASVVAGNTTYTMDFSTVTFDWKNMTDTYGNTSTDAQKNAVATLMKACGYSVKMGYRPDASGAIQSNVGLALINNFGYDKGVQCLYRDFYSINEWNDIIYEQLQLKQPVQYGGQSNAGGHSFVCDGYSQNNFFHINWGWGGMSDGYFLLSVLDPDNQGTGGSGDGSGFDSDQDAIVNFRKPVAGSEIKGAMGASTFTISATSATLGSQLSASMSSIRNMGYIVPMSGMFGIRFVNTSTGKTVICTGNNTFTNYDNEHYYSQNITVVLSNSSSLPAGTYSITPVWRQKVGEDWQEVRLQAGATRYTATVSGSTMKINTLAPILKATKVEPSSPLYRNNPSLVTVTLQNTGEVDYVGNIYAQLLSGTTSRGYAAAMQVNVPAKGTATVEYYASFSAVAGNYTMVITDKDKKKISDQVRVTLENMPELKLTFGDPSIVGNANNVDPRNVQIKMNLTCTSGFYKGTLTTYFFPYPSGSYLGTLNVNVDITAGETQELLFQGDVPALEYGKKYFTDVYYNGNFLTKQTIFTTAADSGISDITADEADVKSVEYYNLQGIKVTGNAAGHYIRVSTLTDGTRRAEHVVVK